MEIPKPPPPGSSPVPASAPVTSRTVTPETTGGGEFDQTIKIKMPGSGMTVFGRYKLERILGRGGMGVVWLADDLKLEIPVALKFLPSLIGLDPAAVKELKTETRRGLELSHPHIVRIYDFVDDEDAAAISMEFVDGRTLSELRLNTETGVFTTAEVSQWLLGVCEALDYAHFQRKLVHRDLKPANIMLTSAGAVAKIADFGIARSLSDTMSRLSAAHIGTSGTLPYMSPQQAMGERPLPTDDVYSLGATIYELLSGKPPFYRGDIPTQISTKVPPSMRERRDELEIKAAEAVPAEWETAIAMCLHKDAAMRPQTAGALAELLGLKPSTSTSKTFVTISRTAAAQAADTKKPLNSIALLAGVMAFAVLAGGAFWFINSNKAPATAPSAAAAPAPAVGPDKGKADAAPADDAKSTAASTTADTAQPAAPVAAPAAPAATDPAAPAPVPPAPAATPAVAMNPSAAAAATGEPPAAIRLPAGTATTEAPAKSAMPAAPGTVPLTPDPAAATASALAAAAPPPVMTQLPVTEPPNGYWSMEQIFPFPPHAGYSENGRRQLLFEVQGLLKAKGLYSSSQDGKEGKGTHNAIVLFQAKNGLVPNGLLDGPTLKAMALLETPDNPEWSPPTVASSSSSTRRRSTTSSKEEPGFLQRATKSVGKFFRGE